MRSSRCLAVVTRRLHSKPFPSQHPPAQRIFGQLRTSTTPNNSTPKRERSERAPRAVNSASRRQPVPIPAQFDGSDSNLKCVHVRIVYTLTRQTRRGVVYGDGKMLPPWRPERLTRNFGVAIRGAQSCERNRCLQKFGDTMWVEARSGSMLGRVERL